jgi:protocatechuate 3,4-dioxygenase beta subunit
MVMNDHDPSRRRSLGLLGAAGLLAVTGRAPAQEAAPACTVTPQQTEGPFFLDTKLQRSDLRAEAGGGARPGVPLVLSLRLLSVAGSRCAPLAGAAVDIWHCDASGVYSGVDGNKGTFLRGYQVSDAQGRVRFTTIYPGWYPGRAVHVHFKLRGKSPAGQGYEFTSQLYFDEALNDKVFAVAPYARAGGRMRNEQDGGFRSGGSRLMLALAPAAQGYTGSFDIGVGAV